MSRFAQSPPDFGGARVCVTGIGLAGASAARALADRGASVVVLDARDGPGQQATAAALAEAGVEVRLGAGDELPDGVDLVVTSPGWRPDQPVLVAAATAGISVWGDVELAYRLRPAGQEWLGVTGTNGKTTTVQMLESILRAAGHRAVACGNVGLPVLDAVVDPQPYDVLAVEVSSFQLHWASTVEFQSAAVLNIAADHIDWHGSFDAYAEAKASIWRGDWYCIYNADDPLVSRLVAGHDDRQDFTLGPLDGHCFGLVGDAIVDRCFGASWPEQINDELGGLELARRSDVNPPAPHNIANALAAAALARALECGTGGRFRVPASAVRDGLRAFTPGGHRIAVVGEIGGVTYVDDSKATNPHAAAASIGAFDHVVWVAGGLAKGARFEDLVAGVTDRLRAVVLIGQDRALVADALARHAPEIPVVEVERTDTGAMDDVVRAAAGLAVPGDTVLLAPACASMDMFTDYAARGDAFAAAAGRLGP